MWQSERAQRSRQPLLLRDDRFSLETLIVQTGVEPVGSGGTCIGTQDSVLYNPGGAQTDSAPDVCPEKQLQYMGRT